MKKVTLYVLVLTLMVVMGTSVYAKPAHTMQIRGYGDFGATMTLASHPTRVEYAIEMYRPEPTPVTQSQRTNTDYGRITKNPVRFQIGDVKFGITKQKQIKKFNGEWINVGTEKSYVKTFDELTDTEKRILNENDNIS